MQAQNVTDISNALLGRKIYEINASLDSIGVWHYKHKPHDLLKRTIVISIEDAGGTTYLFKAILSSNDRELQKINEVVINFRHDSRQHIEALNSISGYDSFHVGINSTDIFYRL